MSIICTLFNPAIDVSYRVQNFEAGATLLDVPSQMLPSGKGLNVARVIQTLGENVAVAGLVGAFDIARFENFIASCKIAPLLFEVPGSVRINVTLHDSQSSCVTHINSLAQEKVLRMQEEFLQFLSTHVDGGWWCMSGSLPPGFEDDVYARLIGICKRGGANCLLDTRGLPLKIGVRGKQPLKDGEWTPPKIITPNLCELEEFFGEEIKGVQHIALMGKRLADLGVEYVFITLGDDGVIAIHGNDCLLCTPPNVRAIDTVGCGDAFAAGVIVALKRGFNFTDVCRMAIACGSSKSLHEGPGIVKLEEVWKFMEEVEITAV